MVLAVYLTVAARSLEYSSGFFIIAFSKLASLLSFTEVCCSRKSFMTAMTLPISSCLTSLSSTAGELHAAVVDLCCSRVAVAAVKIPLASSLFLSIDENTPCSTRKPASIISFRVYGSCILPFC